MKGVPEKDKNDETIQKDETVTNQNEVKEDEAAAEEVCQDILDDITDEEPDSEEHKEEKKHSRFDKKKDKKPDPLKEKVDELEDKVKRQMAEFDNFRKRTEKEKSAMFEVGAKSVIEKILPIVDNFERGLQAVSKEEEGTPFSDGMNMIYKQFVSELGSIGVTPIEATGKEFNPAFHNAVMQVENEELESGMVAQELQKGYMYRDTVVRHSMVSVVI